MKRIWTRGALILALACGAASPAALAATKNKKPSPEHVAAIRKCNADYSAAVRDARGKKGNERREAMAAARRARKQCVADAPK